MSIGVTPSPSGNLPQRMTNVSGMIDDLFEAWLPIPSDSSARLVEAMRYAALGSGKRLRPLLVHSSAKLFDVAEEQSLLAGLAVECIHVHSLIHDDLPCMDDDDLRRGKPTVHVAFDEATAVLAGDALLTLGFNAVCDPRTHPFGDVRSRLAATLATAAGARGMAGGQMMDMMPIEGAIDIESVARLQRLKTGALIGWSVDAGAVLGEADEEARLGLRGYAQKIGLAFQIVDDLLDAEGEAAKVGKRLRKDAGQGKANFVTVLGAERARKQAEMLVGQAIEHLHAFDHRAETLREIARFVIDRDR